MCWATVHSAQPTGLAVTSVGRLELVAQDDHISWPMHELEVAHSDSLARRAGAESEVAPRRYR